MKDLFDIDGKVALVTGGSSGIGLMIARAYVEAGAKVYISSRKRAVCEKVAAELSESGTCIPLPADLSTEAEAVRLAGEIAARESGLHILVNNAGASTLSQAESGYSAKGAPQFAPALLTRM